MFAPAVLQAANELGGGGATIAPLMLSIYVLGWTAGPILVAPISETRGRLPVYLWSSILYIVFTAACAVSPNAIYLILFRFLAGAVGSTPLSLGAGTISDLIPVQQRGLTLSMYMVGPILGPSVGPLVGGCLTDRWGWRSIFWGLLALYGLAALAQVAIMRETYAPAILARKARRLGVKSALDEEGLSSREALARALVRPTKLTIRSPINMFISIVSAYVNGLLFLIVATLPLVFGTEYHFGPREVGLAFNGIGIGNVIGLAVFASTSDRWVRKRLEEGSLKPEDRLLPVVATGPMLAVGLF
ncbi:MFS transporter [Apiospora saccharicola]|uniref:MFS transporter n=1 Tax=Apiospora saccharicola TaxID=335842 RepID=A0ABR1UN82_9PEZI